MKKTAILILLALLAFTPMAWAWNGSGTEDDPYQINSESDWTQLCTNVNNGNNYSGKFFQLTNNISVSTMVGSSRDKRFSGIFDGNGHTLTFNYTDNSSNDYCAPFRFINGATIKYLHVAGTIVKSDGKNAGGLVGLAEGDNTISNCRSSVDIHFNKNGDVSSGSFIGELRESGSTTLNNCLFDGKLRGANANKWGGFVGWVATGRTVTFNNCLFNPTLISINTNGCMTFARHDGTVNVNNCYYKTLIKDAQGATNASNMNNEQLLAALGGGWETVTENDVEKVVPVMALHSLTGYGTEASPYQISSTDDWNNFAANVFLGQSYSGNYFKLTNNISVTRMVGVYGKSFNGIFNGNGKTLTVTLNSDARWCAPFAFTYGATIKDLITAGTIETSNRNAGGVVGRNGTGKLTLTNVTSSVTINSTYNGVAEHGGLVGYTLQAEFTGCAFTGSLTGANSTNCGGLLGYKTYESDQTRKATFTNCVFAPTSVTVSATNFYTFANNSTNGIVEITNCYYTQALGTAQGTLVHSITPGNYVTVAYNGNATSVYGVSGITCYVNGIIMLNNVLYASNDQTVSLNLGHTLPDGCEFSSYQISAGTLVGSQNPYTLTMPNEDVIVNVIANVNPWQGEGDEGSPYLISDASDWDLLAVGVNLGYTYSGKYFQLTDDISVTTMVGTDGHKFKGHFDGNGKTLTLSYGSAGTPFSEDYCAPFRYIERADIHNLIVDGTIHTSKQFAAGIAGYALNNNAITDCRSSVIINSSVSGDGTHGGFVANCQNKVDGATYVTFTRCAFNGQLLGSATKECGGFVGWAAGNDWAGVKFIDCIFAPSAVSILTDGSATFSRGQSNSAFITVSVENSYYTQCFGTRQGELAYTTQPTDVTTEAMTIAGVTVYVKKTLVTNVAATDITPNTATISWTGSDACSNYQVRYRVKPDNTLYFTDFEDGIPEDWTMFDNDDDEHNWTYYDTPGKNMSHSGNGCMYSASYINNYGALNPDNWLVSPQLTLGGTMKVWLKGQDENDFLEHFAIYLSTTGNSMNDFTTVLVPETETTCDYQEYTADLSAYSGQGYIAIRHFNCYSQYFLVVDDFGLYNDNAGGQWTVVTDASPTGTTLTGLTPNTTYEYQVEYNYGGHTFYTTTANLTTLAEDVAPFNLRANAITAHTATISWTGYADSYNLSYSQGGLAQVTLSVPNDFWQDGTGYQMLLDADHNTYGTVIPASGGLTTSGDASPETYANFEYKIPTNADGNLNTTNVVNGTTVTEATITIVAGIYDWCITNPSPGDGRVWIASEHGNVGGRQDDFVFEAGKHYTFTVTFDDGSGNDCVNMTVEDDATLTPGSVTYIEGITNTSYTLSSLNASADYTVNVQSVKGNKTSDWSSIYFTTLAGIDFVVTGYGDSDGGWVFIASPVATDIVPDSVSGLVATNASHYDLYRLNPDNTMWENYKNTTHHDGFKLVNGKGYLYASKEGTTLTFTGASIEGNTKKIGISEGWNLVGNPFTDSVTINKSYYTLDGTGSYIVATEVSGTTAIAACHGVIVEATSANDSVLFTKVTQQAAAPNNGGLSIALSQASSSLRGGTTKQSSIMDKAIISFNEGSQLGKFYFGTQAANIYLPQNNEEYAIAFSEKTGEMPLNFKAAKSGTYTLTVKTDGVELAYLHLIDNLTGADIDLLQPNALIAGKDPQFPSPQYTFTAKTTDYESRFKLVFVCGDANDNNEAFAFISNGNIIVNGEGTLQVIDMTGRVIHSIDVARNVSTSGMSAGVYVLRLINGDDVKTQKIVVR